MSYANMDHAAWVERNNAAGRSLSRKPKKNGDGVVVGCHAAPEKLSPFQARVMDILGMVFGGIYNAPINWGTVDWNCGNGGVSVVISGPRSWATWDFDNLTRFVFLCHVARIRGSIESAGPRGYRMMFWQRGKDGGVSRRHPDLAEAVAAFDQEYLPADHHVRWKEPAPVSAAAE